MVILVPVGALRELKGSSSSDDGDGDGDVWMAGDETKRKEVIDRVREQVLMTIYERTGEDWRGHIKHEIINDPVICELSLQTPFCGCISLVMIDFP